MKSRAIETASEVVFDEHGGWERRRTPDWPRCVVILNVNLAGILAVYSVTQEVGNLWATVVHYEPAVCWPNHRDIDRFRSHNDRRVIH